MHPPVSLPLTSRRRHTEPRTNNELCHRQNMRDFSVHWRGVNHYFEVPWDRTGWMHWLCCLLSESSSKNHRTLMTWWLTRLLPERLPMWASLQTSSIYIYVFIMTVTLLYAGHEVWHNVLQNDCVKNSCRINGCHSYTAFTPALFSLVESNLSVFHPFGAVHLRRWECSSCTAVRTRSGPNKLTETWLKRWSQYASKRTLVRFICGENMIQPRSALTAKSTAFLDQPSSHRQLHALRNEEAFPLLQQQNGSMSNLDKRGEWNEVISNDQHQNQPAVAPPSWNYSRRLPCLPASVYHSQNLPTWHFWPIREHFRIYDFAPTPNTSYQWVGWRMSLSFIFQFFFHGTIPLRLIANTSLFYCIFSTFVW